MGTVWKDTVWKGIKRNITAWELKAKCLNDEIQVFESGGKRRITGIASLKVTKLK